MLPATYEILPGYRVFDCPTLRASLSPDAYRDNWAQKKCLACINCPTGAAHAGKEVQQVASDRFDPRICVRCQSGCPRLVFHHLLCIGCYNRQREVEKGKNGKDTFPELIARRLHRAYALLSASAEAVKEFLAASRGSPSSSKIGAGAYWLEFIAADSEEIERAVSQMLPGSVLLDFELGPTLAEWHRR